jgi:hypothetical protein
MAKLTTPKRNIKILRNSEAVDRNSSAIRSDQSAALKALCNNPPTTVVKRDTESRVKLNTNKAEKLYTAGKTIICAGCERLSPTKVMYKYKNTSRGEVILCQKCYEDAEVRSFQGLDALDRKRKRIKIGDD